MDRVMLIDFNNFAWKANVLFKPKPQVEGYEDAKQESPVKAEAPPQNIVIFNFFRNLRALLDPFSPHKVICVLEGHPAFRYELLPTYKANRIIKTGSDQTKSDLSRIEAKARLDLAMPEILRLMKYLPISTARHAFYEADDLISSLVEDLKDEDVIVVSGDSDLIQLLQLGYKQVRLYHPIKKVIVEAPPHHYLTYKALAGDTSDNIPSCMGKKTAEKTVRDPQKLKDWLDKSQENRDAFLVNKQLIELSKVNLEEVEMEAGVADYPTLKIEFDQLEFSSLVKSPYWEKFVSTFKSIKF